MRKLQSTADSLKESRDIAEREAKGLRDRIEFLSKGSKDDTLRAAAEIEAARNAAAEAKQELAAARDRIHQLNLVAQRQGDQLGAGESRFDALTRELAAARSKLASMKVAYEERGAALQRLTDAVAEEKARARNASEIVSTLQQSANDTALRGAEERTEASKTIVRLERSVEELDAAQPTQRPAAGAGPQPIDSRRAAARLRGRAAPRQ